MGILEIIGYIVLPLLTIDLFYLIYTYGCKFYMRRRGIDEKDLNKVRKPLILIAYSVFVVFSIISVFVFNSYYTGTFTQNLGSEFLLIVALSLLLYGCFSIFAHLKHYFLFAKNVYSELKDSKNNFDHFEDKFRNNDVDNK